MSHDFDKTLPSPRKLSAYATGCYYLRYHLLHFSKILFERKGYFSQELPFLIGGLDKTTLL